MSMTDLDLAITLAHEAGEILLEKWADRGRLSITRKRAGDFASEADFEAERHLKTRLSRLRPEDGWLGEETGAGPVSARRWIVDPLDGTTNFLRGIPHWAVSIALETEAGLCVGVVHDPVKQETFAAGPGPSATLNDAPLVLPEPASLEAALFGTGIPFGGMPHIDEHASDIARLMPLCAGVRRMGAAALDLAYVAAGRLDGFWERRLQPWDIAAGLVLLRQAGARVEGWKPGETPEEYGNVIAAPGAIFGSFAGVLRRADHDVSA